MKKLWGKARGFQAPPLALIAILLSLAVGLSNLQLAITSLDTVLTLWPVTVGPPPPGADAYVIHQNFARSLVGLAAMGVLALLMTRAALFLLQQRRNAFQKAIVLASASPLFSFLLFSLSDASKVTRVALAIATIAFLVLPANREYFSKQHDHPHYHRNKWKVVNFHGHFHDHQRRARRGHHHP